MARKTLAETVSGQAIDKAAGLVTGAGVHYEQQVNLSQDLWTDAPPPMIEPTWGEDLRGTTVGRLSAFGYFDRHRLVVRCCCGNFELRGVPKWRKRLKAGNNDLHCCQQCDNIRHLRHKAHWLRTGKNLDSFGKPLAPSEGKT